MMTQNQLKQLFSQYSGYVYEYKGLVPDGESPQEYIVEQFVAAANRLSLAVSLVQVKTVYLLHSSESILTESFQLIADLSYQEPLPESESLDDSTVEPQGEE